jgi:hypothetical protein
MAVHNRGLGRLEGRVSGRTWSHWLMVFDFDDGDQGRVIGVLDVGAEHAVSGFKASVKRLRHAASRWLQTDTCSLWTLGADNHGDCGLGMPMKTSSGITR